jgi:hypothetical protein
VIFLYTSLQNCLIIGAYFTGRVSPVKFGPGLPAEMFDDTIWIRCAGSPTFELWAIARNRQFLAAQLKVDREAPPER